MSDLDPDSYGTSSEEIDADEIATLQRSSQPQPPTSTRETGNPSNSALPDRLPHGTSPIQKRRRVTRACDECRRKKIKCDGKQPCTHCTVYSYQCTYDQPSNRRRNPASQQVEALEARLRKAEELLKTVIPNANLDELLRVDSSTPPVEKPKPPECLPKPDKDPGQTYLKSEDRSGDKDNDSLLRAMVDATGQLDIDDDGNPDFHGQSSGIVFLRKVREQFGDMMGNAEGYGKPFLKKRNLGPIVRSPPSASQSSLDAASPGGNELPPKECAILLCDVALNDACALMRFVHQPDFWAKFHHVYDFGIDNLGDAETRFLPLLFSALALGTLFAKVARSKLQSMGYESAIEQGFGWFSASREMLNLTDLRDLASMQAVLFMVLYLQSSSRLSTCYTYVGILTRNAARMGLHRSLAASNFNPIEHQIRKRVFWTIIKMDIYVGALLGLPMGIDHDEMDQDLPYEVDDEYITSDSISRQPPGKMSLMCACNAHTRLVFILKKTMRYVYPITHNLDATSGGDKGYMVSFAKVREIEKDLEEWKASLPEPLKPGSEAPPDIIRTQQLLRMAYAHIQLFLYRPFLHYATVQSRSKQIDKRCYGCAAACVNISRNIIHITTSMRGGGLLNGAYWFYMYTTFFAVLSLVYYVLGNPKSLDSEGFLGDAFEGKDNLKILAKTSLAADRCTQTLAGLFEELSERWKSLRAKPEPKKKRPANSLAPRTDRIAPRTERGPMQQSPSTSVSHGDTAQDIVKSKDQISKPKGEWNSPPGQTSTQWNQNAPSGVPIDPTDFSSMSPMQPASATQSILRFQQQVPDFNNMMFPSPDPFAYPNPPMTTLESRQIKQERQYSPSNMPPSSDPSQNMSNALSPTFDDFGAQTFGALPPYLMQAQQPGMGFQDMGPGFDLSGMSSAPGAESVMTSNADPVGPSWYPQGSNTSQEQDPTMAPTAAEGYQPWIGQVYGGPR